MWGAGRGIIRIWKEARRTKRANKEKHTMTYTQELLSDAYARMMYLSSEVRYARYVCYVVEYLDYEQWEIDYYTYYCEQLAALEPMMYAAVNAWHGLA
jgi:hypothetical protein